MKRFLSLLLTLSMLALLLALFSSCKEEEVITLYVYNWGEYISDGSEGSLNVNAAFEEWYEQNFHQKVKVNYSTFSSNESMYAKLNSGASTYDIVVPSDYMVERMIKEGMLRRLDKEKITNLVNIDYDLLFRGEAPYYDPENAYSVPYTYGTVGIIYNTTMVDEADLGSWDIMWNEKYEGNILQFNNSRDAFATAQLKLGCGLNSVNDADWYAALELLKEQKPLVQSYVMDEIFNKMENGSAAIAPYYAGDFFTMYEDNDDLGFFYPREGTNIFVDAMCIPTNAAHPEIAEQYINFMLTKEAAIANAEYICYASPNKLVRTDSDYQKTMSEIHPDAMSILYGTEDISFESYQNLPTEKLNLLNSLWEELKIESSIGTAIIVIACAILGGTAAATVFFFVRRRRRRRILASLWSN